MIEVRDLRFAWGGSEFELVLPRLDVGPGQRLAVAGPSGAGKSTLLGLLAGTLAAQHGSVVVAGQQLAGASEAQRRRVRARHVGQVFQDFPLVDALDARENILLPYRLQPELALDDAARRRADALLERLGLTRLAHRRPRALSQGERQRVAIARALVTGPTLVLADEPTAGLDPARAQGVIDLLFDLTQGGTALVLVAHDPAVLARFDARLQLASPA